MDTSLLKALLLSEYGLDLSLKPLPGEVDLNYKASDDSGNCYVLKVAGSSRNEDEIAYQISLLEHLKKSDLDFETPTVVCALSGQALLVKKLEGQIRILHLLSWVNGKPLRSMAKRSDLLLSSWGDTCGQLSKALSTFDHSAAHRFYRWDPQHTGHAKQQLELIQGAEDHALAAKLFTYFELEVYPNLSSLRHGVNYNDAHEDNLLIQRNGYDAHVSGLVDVGDSVYTQVINELAIACAYASMDCPDPIAAMCTLTRAYHQQFPLLENELEALFGLTIGRLLLTVTSAAEARTSDPDNAYRSISEKQAWEVLRKLARVAPSFAVARFREVCGYEPCKNRALFNQWISSEPAFHPLVKPTKNTLGAKSTFTPLDFTVGSKSLGHYSKYTSLKAFEKTVIEMQGKYDFGYGGYLETRPFYTTNLFQHEGNQGPRWRTVHLGLDLWAPAGCKVYAPLDGRIHSFRQNTGDRDYGATLVLEHAVKIPGNEDQELNNLTFYTLFGHLSTDSLTGKTVGMNIQAGDLIAHTGNPEENGGWPPHLHVQVMLDLLENYGDFPGVAFPEEIATWASISPDPSLIAGLSFPANSSTDSKLTTSEITEKRRHHLGRSLSLSYDQPLHIVRGMGAYLLDSTGRRFLDTVNNVAHVGHEHPEVVKAIQQQAAVLNTNTRYLHEEIVAFAEELCATLPPELSVVHVVNSGSEANELALRMARASSGQRDIIAVEVGYHGNTNAVIDVSSYKFDGKGGQGAPPTTHIVPIPDVYRGLHRNSETAGVDYASYLDSIIEQVNAKGRGIAGFICESILSCGGQVVLPKGYLKAAYAKTRAAGGVCIADEVQVGVGRVGTHFWGFELQNVIPDIVVVGKPIGNGHPLGVVVCTPAVADSFAATGMEYFNTFGGNPVSCAAGRAVLRVVKEQGLQQHALSIGNYFIEGLTNLQDNHQAIGDVRGHGLFLGFELVKDRLTLEPDEKLTSYLANQARQRGLLLSTDGPYHNVIKIKPPLVIEQQEADFVLATIDSILTASR